NRVAWGPHGRGNVRRGARDHPPLQQPGADGDCPAPGGGGPAPGGDVPPDRPGPAEPPAVDTVELMLTPHPRGRPAGWMAREDREALLALERTYGGLQTKAPADPCTNEFFDCP